MENRLFSAQNLETLLSPERWQVNGGRIGTGAPVAGGVGDGVVFHKHPHREALFVLSGSGSYCVRGGAYPCYPGALFLIDSFEEHQLGYTPDFPDAEHLWMFISEDHIVFHLVELRAGAPQYATRWSHVTAAPSGRQPMIQQAFGPGEGAVPAELARMEVYSGLMATITTIVREGYSLAPDPSGSESFQQDVIAAIRRHIAETSGRGASLEALAQISGYSKYHFLRLFTEYSGVSVHGYIDRCRLRKTAEMEREGRLKKEIAAQLGFSSLSAFSRWYKKAREE